MLTPTGIQYSLILSDVGLFHEKICVRNSHGQSVEVSVQLFVDELAISSDLDQTSNGVDLLEFNEVIVCSFASSLVR